jgi:CRISPR-associated protein Cas6/Cse3/CasE subtype I-E
MLIERYLQPEEASAPDEQQPALVEVCFGVPAALAGDVYALHQTLELTIGARAETGYLFTLASDDARPVCVVRCRQLPPHLLAKAVPVPVLSAGREAAFRVHATLTMKNGSGQRRPVRHDNSKARTAWLERHAAAGGFRVIGADHSTSKRWIDRKGRRFWIDDTVFFGRLAVTDEALFTRTMESGLGHGRAWGFGLLQIRPD